MVLHVYDLPSDSLWSTVAFYKWRPGKYASMKQNRRVPVSILLDLP
jgi:hypothetical protein